MDNKRLHSQAFPAAAQSLRSKLKDALKHHVPELLLDGTVAIVLEVVKEKLNFELDLNAELQQATARTVAAINEANVVITRESTLSADVPVSVDVEQPVQASQETSNNATTERATWLIKLLPTSKIVACTQLAQGEFINPAKRQYTFAHGLIEWIFGDHALECAGLHTFDFYTGKVGTALKDIVGEEGSLADMIKAYQQIVSCEHTGCKLGVIHGLSVIGKSLTLQTTPEELQQISDAVIGKGWNVSPEAIYAMLMRAGSSQHGDLPNLKYSRTDHATREIINRAKMVYTMVEYFGQGVLLLLQPDMLDGVNLRDLEVALSTFLTHWDSVDLFSKCGKDILEGLLAGSYHGPGFFLQIERADEWSDEVML